MQADPPTPAESGIVTVSNIVFEEGVETLPVQVRDHQTITVAYLDDTARTRIGQELRERIGDCRTRVSATFTALPFSLTEIPAADETASCTFELPPTQGLPNTPPAIASCEIARVDAVVVRACARRGELSDEIDVRAVSRPENRHHVDLEVGHGYRGLTNAPRSLRKMLGS